MTKIAIIDDEKKIIKTIINFLSENMPEIEIVGSANSVDEGINLINLKKPDLILLDIEMPNANGFELLKEFPNRKFNVIFITAYDEYAVEAFKVNAIDYLLKPFDEDELINSIKRIKSKDDNSYNTDRINTLLNQMAKQNSKKIRINTKNGIEFIEINNIVKIDADGNYCNIIIENKAPIYATKKIKELDQLLSNNKFFRSHKSTIINLEKVIKYDASDNYILMSDDSQASLSRYKRDSFLNKMGELF